MKKWQKILFATAAALLAGLLLWSFSSMLSAAEDSTQNFSPSRYALMSAEINVASQQPGLSYTRKVIMRTDTATGQCWILELTVPGANDFKVVQANWKPVPVGFTMQNSYSNLN